MTPKPNRSTTSGAAYLDLRKLAGATNRPTDELQQLYALEGFLHRLTRTGVPLAAYTERRPTRDVDLATHQLQADSEAIHTIVNEILAVAVDDGLSFNLDKTSVETIRDDCRPPRPTGQGLRVTSNGSAPLGSGNTSRECRNRRRTSSAEKPSNQRQPVVQARAAQT